MSPELEIVSFPTRADLDRPAPARPGVPPPADGHAGVVNSAMPTRPGIRAQRAASRAYGKCGARLCTCRMPGVSRSRRRSPLT